MNHEVLGLNFLVTGSYLCKNKTMTGADSRLSVRLFLTLVIAEDIVTQNKFKNKPSLLQEGKNV